MVVFIFVEMLHLQPVLLLDAEAPVLAVADLDLVRSGPALSQRHQQALPSNQSLVLSALRPGVLQRIWVNHGDNIMLPGSLISVAT